MKKAIDSSIIHEVNTLRCLTCRQDVYEGWQHAKEYKHHSFTKR